MKVSWRTELPQLILITGMFILAVSTWGYLPNQLPVHWNGAGQIDGYGSKARGLFLVPFLSLGQYLLLLLLPRIDPGRANYARFAGAYSVIRISIAAALAGTYMATILLYLGRQINVTTVAMLFAGGLLIVLGELMAKIRPNWFVGIRTPWTLSSKAAWTKTHRLGGWLFIATGVCLMAIGWVHTKWAPWVILGAVTGTMVWTFSYSYLVWRSDPDKIPPAGTLPAEGV